MQKAQTEPPLAPASPPASTSPASSSGHDSRRSGRGSGCRLAIAVQHIIIVLLRVRMDDHAVIEPLVPRPLFERRAEGSSGRLTAVELFPDHASGAEHAAGTPRHRCRAVRAPA